MSSENFKRLIRSLRTGEYKKMPVYQMMGKKVLEKETNITALVRTTKSEIDDFLKGEKIGKARESKSEIDALCAMKGVEVGRNVEICKGIHAETVSEDLRLR